MNAEVKALEERIVAFQQVQENHKTKRSEHDKLQREAGAEVARLQKELIEAYKKGTSGKGGK
jgi:hypothetical protein